MNRVPLTAAERRARLQPGQYFRNSDSYHCRRLIKRATAADLPDLVEAQRREYTSPRRRPRLSRALVEKICELAEQEDAAKKAGARV